MNPRPFFDRDANADWRRARSESDERAAKLASAHGLERIAERLEARAASLGHRAMIARQDARRLRSEAGRTTPPPENPVSVRSPGDGSENWGDVAAAGNPRTPSVRGTAKGRGEAPRPECMRAGDGFTGWPADNAAEATRAAAGRRDMEDEVFVEEVAPRLAARRARDHDPLCEPQTEGEWAEALEALAERVAKIESGPRFPNAADEFEAGRKRHPVPDSKDDSAGILPEGGDFQTESFRAHEAEEAKVGDVRGFPVVIVKDGRHLPLPLVIEGTHATIDIDAALNLIRDDNEACDPAALSRDPYPRDYIPSDPAPATGTMIDVAEARRTKDTLTTAADAAAEVSDWKRVDHLEGVISDRRTEYDAVHGEGSWDRL